MNVCKKLLAICVAGAALFSAAVEARQTKVKIGDHGLVDVVRRGGCISVLWTSEAMKLSKFDKSRLTHLRVGDVVTLPDNCWKVRPPAEIKEATLRLFKHEELEPAPQQQENSSGSVVRGILAERDREVLTLRAEKQMLDWKARIANTDLRMASAEAVILKQEKLLLDGKLKIADADRATAKREVVTLKEEKRRLADDLAIANTKLAGKKAGPNSSWWIAVGGVIALNILMFVAVWLLVIRKLRADAKAVDLVVMRVREEKVTLELELRLAREENQFLTVQVASLNDNLRVAEEDRGKLMQRLSASVMRSCSIVYHGEVIEFKDSSDHTVACPYCNAARKITADPQNMHRHLDEKHPHLRIKKITPAEMRRKLALVS